MTLGHGWARHGQQPLISAVHAMRGQRFPGSAPSATRTRDLLLRRHNRPSAVQTSNDARHQQAKQPKAVAVRTILLRPGTRMGTVQRWWFEADAWRGHGGPNQAIAHAAFRPASRRTLRGFGSHQARPERAAIAFGSSSDPTSARNLLSSSSWSVAAPSTRPKCGS